MDSVIVHSVWCLLSSFSLSYKVNIEIYKKPQSYRPKDGGAQIPVARSLRRLNFVMWCLIFVGDQCACHRSDPRILRWFLYFWNICTPLPYDNR